MPRIKGGSSMIKVCLECGLSQPFSEFMPKDGIPQSRVCRRCRNQHRRNKAVEQRLTKTLEKKKVKSAPNKKRETSVHSPLLAYDVDPEDSHSVVAAHIEASYQPIIPKVKEEIVVMAHQPLPEDKDIEDKMRFALSRKSKYAKKK